MMQAERGRRAGFPPTDGFDNMDSFASFPTSPSSSSSSTSPRSSNRIEHRVSKMDTLAGVAIKYGVEVADIRRMNGLVTDLQMFAHKSLNIPLPGRHPPSPVLSNGTLKGQDWRYLHSKVEIEYTPSVFPAQSSVVEISPNS